MLLLRVFPGRHNGMSLLHCFLVDCMALGLKAELELGLLLASLLGSAGLFDGVDGLSGTRAAALLQHVMLVTLTSDRRNRVKVVVLVCGLAGILIQIHLWSGHHDLHGIRVRVLLLSWYLLLLRCAWVLAGQIAALLLPHVLCSWF